METTGIIRGYVALGNILGLYRGMEKNMETTTGYV